MSEIKETLELIRQYESNADFARRSNEKELPNLKFLVSDISKFGFGNEDLDLKQRLVKVAEKMEGFEVVGITDKILDECRKEVNYIKDELLQRYKDRMDSYASRQSNI